MQDLWVVLLSSSRYYHNYRHFANTAAIYSIVKNLGLRDDHIFFLDASDLLSDYRNLYRGDVYFDHQELFNGKRSLFYENNNSTVSPIDSPRIDFRGEEINIDLLRDLFLYKLPLTSSSKILFYLTGHGGDEFFKFHDFEEWNAIDFTELFQKLHYHRRYQEILVILDTCQASTMVSLELLLSQTPNVTVLASSLVGENSYSYYPHDELGLPIVDRFTYKIYEYFYLNFLKRLENPTINRGKSGQSRIIDQSIINMPKRSKSLTITDLFRSIDSNFISSTPYLQYSKRIRKFPYQTYLIDFFAAPQYSAVRNLEEELICNNCYHMPSMLDQNVGFEDYPSARTKFHLDCSSNFSGTVNLLYFLIISLIVWKLFSS